MLATMERLPFTQPFQLPQSSMSMHSPPIQSPRAAATYPGGATFGLPSPAGIHYASTATSAAAPTATARSRNSSSLPPVQSPPPYQSELIDHTSSIYQAATGMHQQQQPPLISRHDQEVSCTGSATSLAASSSGAGSPVAISSPPNTSMPNAMSPFHQTGTLAGEYKPRLQISIIRFMRLHE